MKPSTKPFRDLELNLAMDPDPFPLVEVELSFLGAVRHWLQEEVE